MGEGASYDALLLAGRRPGEDPFARSAGVRHRALVPVAGEPMLQRVVSVLREHPRIARICVSIDAPELLEDTAPLSDWVASGALQVRRAAISPSQSVLEALDARAADVTADAPAGPAAGPASPASRSGAAKPLLVTTADHALLDSQILDQFLRGADETGADLAVGFVTRRVLTARYPESKRTYLPFRNDAISGANLFALRTGAAHGAVEFWQRVEVHRKRPWRLVRAFGLTNLALFTLRRLSVEAALARASAVIGARCAGVPLPIAEAAIDVDRPADLALVERILASRSQSRASSR